MLEEQSFDSPDDEEDGQPSVSAAGKRNRPGTLTFRKRIRNEISKNEVHKQNGKTFQDAWLQEYKWLVKVQGDKTKACDKILNAGKSEVEKHAEGKKHKIKVESIANVPTITDALKGPSVEAQIETAAKKAEISLGAFFIHHSIPPNVADHLMDTMKNVITDSKICKKMTFDRTKCTALLTNVIAETETEELVVILNGVKFSILVDESTDQGGKKNMAIVVKYTDKTGDDCVDVLKIVELDSTDCSAEGIFDKFQEASTKVGVPMTNILAVGVDHAPVMMGNKNSFVTRLKVICPWLVVMDCICHSGHIAATHACAKLPANAVTLVRRIATYISGSPKRTAIFEEFQEFYKQEKVKVKKLSATRWLVLHPCVVRILENWLPLEQFFSSIVLEDMAKTDLEARAVLDDLRNPFSKAYLYFLKYALDYFNKMNALFMHEKVMIHTLYDEAKALLKQVCSNYMRENVLNSVAAIDVSYPHFMMPLERIVLGPNVEEILLTIPLPNVDPARPMTQREREDRRVQDIKTFRLRCLDFYTTAARQLQLYLPVNRALIKEAKFLDPAVALSSKAREEFPCLPALTRQLKDVLELDADALYSEWRHMPLDLPDTLKAELAELGPGDFWKRVSKLTDFNNEPKFPNLCKLAARVRAFPHSNADVERIFSNVTDTKTFKRARMGNKLLNAICVGKAAMRRKRLNCFDYKVTKAHLAKHNKDMYKEALDFLF